MEEFSPATEEGKATGRIAQQDIISAVREQAHMAQSPYLAGTNQILR